LKEARKTVLPLLHATALCLLSHPAPKARAAALDLTRKAKDADAAILEAWSDWSSSSTADVEHKLSSPSSTNNLQAFEMITGGELGESLMVSKAADKHYRHYSRFYLPSDSMPPTTSVDRVSLSILTILLSFY